MRERIITSLRSVISQIDDKTGIYKDLHDLFNQAEGPALATKFLGTINLTKPENHKKIADVLSQAGITQQSLADDAVNIFGDHVKKSLATYNLSDDTLLSYVEAATGQLEACFDGHIRGFLTDGSSSSEAMDVDQSVSGAMEVDESVPGKTKKRPREDEETEANKKQRIESVPVDTGSSSSSSSIPANQIP